MPKKDRKQTQRKIRKSLGIIADVAQIIQFLWSVSKPILAKAAVATVATALVGGTVIVGKNIVEQKTDILNKDASTEKVITEPTLFESIVEEGRENIDIEKKTPLVTSRVTTSASTTSVITADMGWGHITQDPTIAAFYMLIHNTGAETDRLTGGTSSICGRVRLQDMSIAGSPGTGDISSITIPAGSTIELKFMERRILCYGVSEVKLGDHVPLTLIFEKHGKVTIMAEIRNLPDDWPESFAPPELIGLQSYAQCSQSPSISNSLNVFSCSFLKNSTVELGSGRSYWIRMSNGFEGDNGKAEAIADKNNITFSVNLNGSELKISGDTKIEYNNGAGFWEINGYYCTGILEKGSYEIVGTSYRSGSYVDSASFILIAK